MTAPAERYVTPRGFVVYDQFTDTRGAEVRVQQSSSATHTAVWVFCGSDNDYETPHLNVEQATRVRDALTAFITEHSDGATS